MPDEYVFGRQVKEQLLIEVPEPKEAVVFPTGQEVQVLEVDPAEVEDEYVPIGHGVQKSDPALML